MRQRGVLTLPAELRRRLRLDEEGAQVQVVERADGIVELRPVVTVPAEQAWFWTDRWQQMEREADREIAAGAVHHAEGLDDLIDILDTSG
jgi:bifunctional DNA-binding transcriptional regulator/antitoxin component of YhaV-PrlF toxin-antitoxin module